MKEQALLTGELRVLRVQSAGQRKARLGEIERELSGIRYELNALRGWSPWVSMARNQVIERRAKLEDERERLVNGGGL